MKTFKQFLIESESDTFVYCFGRYSPTTKGHIAHFQAVQSIAKKMGAPYCIYTSKTFDNKKNPVPVDEKIAYIQKALPGVNIAPAVNMFKLLDELIPRGFKKIIYVAGGDYFEEGSEENKLFSRMIPYAEQNGIQLEAVSSGDRTPGISGSDLRKAVITNDFPTFLEASPIGIGNITETDVRMMFNICKNNLKGL